MSTNQPSNKSTTSLLNEFQATSIQDWEELALKQLKGAPIEKLITKTVEGILIKPIYTADSFPVPTVGQFPGTYPYSRGQEASGSTVNLWQICQKVTEVLPEDFNTAIKKELNGGAHTIYLTLNQAGQLGKNSQDVKPEQFSNGVAIDNLEDLQKALADLDITKHPLMLDVGIAGLPFLALLKEYCESQKINFDQLQGNINFDPLALLAKEGSLPCEVKILWDELKQLVNSNQSLNSQLRTIGVNTAYYAEAGANAVQELAFAIATAVEYARQLTEQNIAADQYLAQIFFNFSIGTNFFMEVSKFRAFRSLWAQVAKNLGGNNALQKTFVHAQNSLWNKTNYDSQVNMLRATIEAFAGILGGCDSLTTTPFDILSGSTNDFSRRIARNIQIILREETYANRVIDPAGGSWCIETLTNELSKKAWDLFQEIEAQGGMLAALQNGFIFQQINESQEYRLQQVNQRKHVLVGTTMYSNLNETPIKKDLPDYQNLQQQKIKALQNFHQKYPRKSFNVSTFEDLVQAAQNGATLSEITNSLRPDQNSTQLSSKLNFHRAAEACEQLRTQSENYKKQHGHLPKIFLANIGSLKDYKPRADFVTTFLQPAGFEIIADQSFATPEEAVQGTLESKAPITVICSSDAMYPEIVPVFTKIMQASERSGYVVLAGYPAEYIEQFKVSGIQDFIHIKANHLETLQRLQQKCI